MENLIKNSYENEVKNMYCPSCGYEIKDDAKFCNMCGEKIVVESENIAVPPQVDNSGKVKRKSGLIIAIAIIFVVVIVGTAIGIKPKGDNNTGNNMATNDISENHSAGEDDASEKKDKEIPKSEPIDYTAIDYPKWMNEYAEELAKLLEDKRHMLSDVYSIVYFDMHEDGIPEIIINTYQGDAQVFEYKDGKFVCLIEDMGLPMSRDYDAYYNCDTKQMFCSMKPVGNSEMRNCRVFHLEENKAVLDYYIDVYVDEKDGMLYGAVTDASSYSVSEKLVGEDVSKKLASFFQSIEIREYKYEVKDFKTGEQEENVRHKIDFMIKEEVKTACNTKYILGGGNYETGESVDTGVVLQMLQEYYVRENNLVSDDWKLKYLDKLYEVVDWNQSYTAMYLVDIDRNGIPELCLRGNDDGKVDAMFTYKDGNVLPIKWECEMDISRICTVDGYGIFMSVMDDKWWQKVNIMQLQGDSLICVEEINLYYSLDGGPNCTVVVDGEEKNISKDETEEILERYNLKFSEYRLEEYGYYYVEGDNTFDYDCGWPESGSNITAGRGDVTVWYLEDYIMNY